MDSPSNIPDIAVYQINAGNGDGADLIFDYNGQRISVSVFPSVRREEGQDEALAIILDAGRAAFDHVVAQAHAPLGTAQQEQNLHALLYPPTPSSFCLQAVSGAVTVVPIQARDAYTVQSKTLLLENNNSIHSELGIRLDDSLPRYASKDIVVSELLVCGSSAVVARVRVDGRDMLCKANGRGLADTCLARELTALQTLRTRHAGSVLRVPHMLGYIRHAESGAVVGLLRQWIPGEVLRGIDVAAVPRVTRQTWMAQIHQTVHHLHAMDLVWGDGKAANIIIDKDDNAWLVDFGGGWTDGWVDEALAGSVQGDDQAVKRIIEFLGLG